MQVRVLEDRRNCLRSLSQIGGQGLDVSLFKHSLLVAALAVGIALSPANAHAPVMTDKDYQKHVVAKMEPRDYARHLVKQRWENGEKEWRCLAKLWGKESAWNHRASNPHSSAYGIPQFLNATWVNYGYPVRPKDPRIQIEAGLKYIKSRYKTPCKAWKFWLKEAGPDGRGGWY